MFIIRTAITNLKRYRQKSIINLLICTVVLLLLNLFMGSLESNKRQLKALPEVMPIHAQVSNLNGTLQTGLVIREEKVDQFLQSEYICDLSMTVVLSVGVGENEENSPGALKTVDAAAVTRLQAINGVKEEDVALASDATLDLLLADAPSCFLEEEFLKNNQLQIGQSIPLTVYYDYLDRNSKYTKQYLGTETFYIAGSMKSSEGEYIPSIILPFQWTRTAFRKQDLSFVANAAYFKVKDPLLLNEFKKEMKEELHMMEINPMSDYAYAGNALAVYDETFILSASRIQDNISLLNRFLPFVFITIIFIGYITSYLLIQNRRGQYAIMRSLGVSKGMCYNAFFAESIMVELIGGGLGSILSIILTGKMEIMQVFTFALFIICYVCGTSAALYQLGKISVMKALAQKD